MSKAKVSPQNKSLQPEKLVMEAFENIVLAKVQIDLEINSPDPDAEQIALLYVMIDRNKMEIMANLIFRQN